MAAKFPASILSSLKYYVYVYLDPRDNTIFYVGKGVGNRAFAHLAADTEKEKSRRIREIRAATSSRKSTYLYMESVTKKLRRR